LGIKGFGLLRVWLAMGQVQTYTLPEYNFGQVHQTLCVTPAVEAGIADHVWTIEEVVTLLEPQVP